MSVRLKQISAYIWIGLTRSVLSRNYTDLDYDVVIGFFCSVMPVHAYELCKFGLIPDEKGIVEHAWLCMMSRTPT
jgi:hypothetical protein